MSAGNSGSKARLRATTVVFGFAIAVAVLLAVLSIVGARETFEVLATADRVAVGSVLVVVALWVVVWSYTLSVVLEILGVEHTPVDAVVLFGNVVFANSVAPSTYLGGEPFAALLLSRRTGRDYETSFAAVTSVDLLNYAPMLPLAGVGLLYVAATTVLDRTVELALAFVFLLVLALAGTIAVGWHRRERVVAGVATAVGGFSARTSRVVPGVRPVSIDALERRLGAFVANVERVANDRRQLAVALAYSTLGWVLLSAALWFALSAVGHTVAPEIVLFVVPIGAVSNVLPLPGGIGSVEPIVIVLLVATAGIPVAAATAATLLYRAGTYWLPLLFGGGAVAIAHVPVVRSTNVS